MTMDAFKVRITRVKPKPLWQMLARCRDGFGGSTWYPVDWADDTMEIKFRASVGEWRDHFTQRFMKVI